MFGCATPSRLTRENEAKPSGVKELVARQELAVSNAYKIVAVVAVSEQKGILTRAEVLEEMKR